MLEVLGMPYTCSGAIACGLAKDKVKFKKLLRFGGLPTPDFVEVDFDADPERQAEGIIAELGLPLVAKPVYEGGSYGIRLCRDTAEVIEAFTPDPSFGPMFAERFVSGRGFTVAILEGASGVTVLPAHEIVFIDGRPFLDPVELFTPGMSWSAAPSDEDADLVAEMQFLARRAHSAVGAYGLSRTDFKVDADGRPQILELNALPAMTAMSDLPFSAERAGIPFDDLVERILRTAVDRPTWAR
jgi:D-alanine-D-alanine ligase